MRPLVVVCLLLLTACANPSPRESDPVPLGRIGYEAARIAADPWSAM